MKKILTGLVLATVLASPAFAKSHALATESYAAADETYLAASPYDVVINGVTVGRDPDPTIRLQLTKDNYENAW